MYEASSQTLGDTKPIEKSLSVGDPITVGKAKQKNLNNSSQQCDTSHGSGMNTEIQREKPVLGLELSDFQRS